MSAQTREQLEEDGYTFERRTKCGGKICAATLEWWRRVPDPQIAFRVDARTGRLIAHAEECPDGKRVKEKALAVESQKLSRKLEKRDRPASQGTLWKSL